MIFIFRSPFINKMCWALNMNLINFFDIKNSDQKRAKKNPKYRITHTSTYKKKQKKMIYLNYCKFLETSLKTMKLSQQQFQSLSSYIKVTYLKRMDYFTNQDENQYRLRPRLKNQNKAIIIKLFPSLTSNDIDFVCNIVVMHQLCEMEIEGVDGEVAKLEEEMAITEQGVRKMKEKRRKKYRTNSKLCSQSSQQLISQSCDKSIFAKDTADSSQATVQPESQKQ